MITPAIIPERRNMIDYYNDKNVWFRETKNGTKECYSKEYYNSDFTRKNPLEDIQKEILLFQIEELIHS
jgi:hypothetical protein